MATKLESIVIDGQTVWVEVTDVAAAPVAGTRGKFARTSAGGATEVAAALERVDVARTLTAIVAPVHRALQSFAPEEVSLELALGLKGEVGVFVAKSEGNASLKITAKWKFTKPAAGQGA